MGGKLEKKMSGIQKDDPVQPFFSTCILIHKYARENDLDQTGNRWLGYYFSFPSYYFLLGLFYSSASVVRVRLNLLVERLKMLKTDKESKIVQLWKKTQETLNISLANILLFIKSQIKSLT